LTTLVELKPPRITRALVVAAANASLSEYVLGTSMKRTVRLILVAALAIMQGIFGILRAFEFFRMGIYLSMQGILLLPILGVGALTLGKLVLVMALCYILFALGALLHQWWAWGLGLGISLVTGLVVLSLMRKGAVDLWSLLWLIVPVVLVWYLLSPMGRQEFRH
jgi:hypothetical protein